MSTGRLFGLLLGALAASPAAHAEPGEARTIELTFQRAQALARGQSPASRSARGRVAEAQGAVRAASVWPFNPEIRAVAGPRVGPGDTTADLSIGAGQRFELGGQRAKRIAVARAQVASAEARRDDDERRIARDCGMAFVRALYWEGRTSLAQDNLQLAGEIARVAARRHEVGDVGGLEVSVAQASRARATIAVAQAHASRAKALGRLRLLLGITPATRIVVLGDLRGLGIAVPSDAELTERADLRALDALVRHAESAIELGRASRVPELDLGASYALEESAHIAKASVSLSLPVFDHGQGTVVAATARKARLETERLDAHRRAMIELASATEAARVLVAAVESLSGVAALEQAELAAMSSYTAGAIPLGELLAIKRELNLARLDEADILLAMASAQVELAASQSTRGASR